MKQPIILFIFSVSVAAVSYWWHLPTTIPSRLNHTPQHTPQAGAANLALGKKISINQAGQEDLMILPGIGPERAASIIAWRKRHGPFIQTKDLQNVPGIGPLIFQNLANSIEVSNSPTD